MIVYHNKIHGQKTLLYCMDMPIVKREHIETLKYNCLMIEMPLKGKKYVTLPVIE